MTKLNNKISETVISSAVSLKKPYTHKLTFKGKVCACIAIFLGLFWIAVAFFLHGTRISQLITDERIFMRQNMPPYKWWKNPNADISVKIYIFSVLNSNEFLDGSQDKLRFEEIGPIVFREILQHNDVEIHSNSTISYTSHREALYIPELNEPCIMNKTIIVPNMATLGMATFLNDKGFIKKAGFNLMMLSSGDNVFLNTTIYNYLWNTTSPIMKTARDIVPFMLPTDNMGIFSVIYDDYNDRLNVRIGPKYSEDQFFMINTYNHRPTVPGFHPENGDCFASIVNSSEGAAYPQHLTKDSVLWYWRRTLCRAAPLYFEKEITKHSVVGYKFLLHNNSYDRYSNQSADCYKGQQFHLPDGLSDMSKCSFDFSVAASSPHFYARDIEWAQRIEGMKPDFEKHQSYIIVDTAFGIPLEQFARVQSNLVVPKLRGFSKQVEMFNEMVLPMFWIEYAQTDLPRQVLWTLNIFHNVLLHIEPFLPIMFFLLGAAALCLACLKLLTGQIFVKTDDKIIGEKGQVQTIQCAD